ncbi:hypothetical protein LINPERHAP2_LOCUS31465, partial [Linum perenne]
AHVLSNILTSCIVINCAELDVKGFENTIHFPRFLHNINVDEDKQEKIAYVDLSSTGIEYYDSTSTNNVVFFVNEERLRRGSKVLAINDGRVLLMDAVQLVCTLVDTSSFTIDQLPSPTWNTVSNFYQHCSLLSKAVVLVFGTILNGEEWEGVALFCQVGDDRWATFKGPDILQAVSYEGKIYGINYEHEHEHTFVEIEVDQRNYSAYTVKRVRTAAIDSNSRTPPIRVRSCRSSVPPIPGSVNPSPKIQNKLRGCSEARVFFAPMHEMLMKQKLARQGSSKDFGTRPDRFLAKTLQNDLKHCGSGSRIGFCAVLPFMPNSYFGGLFPPLVSN